jgi:L-seryl-tRNA(Ser) seleniumtransferase
MTDEGTGPSRPPSIDSIVTTLVDIDLPKPLLVEAARSAVAAGAPESARHIANARRRSLFAPVINATGVLLHTNLGRAPCAHHQDATYCNLEFDLTTGNRGSRSQVGYLISIASGADDALVVNNGAAAVLLLASVTAAERSLVISRSELVEIGGGFRIPEVVALSRSRMIEVGTTNRTRLSDYVNAIDSNEDVAAILKVHQSNFRIAGFEESVGIDALAEIGPPVLVDLGSGLLDAETPWLDGPPPRWLTGEPAVRQTLAAGASAVTFSADKLFGGPQAGIIAGRADLVASCRKHPLARALRPGSLTLNALQTTILSYLRRDAKTLPFWRLATVPVNLLIRRAHEIKRAVEDMCPAIEIVSCSSTAGGGAVPGREIPSAGLAIGGDWRPQLREFVPPVVTYVRNGQTIFDLRTVDESQDGQLVEALRHLMSMG